jgi:hypothetical protein
MLAAGCVLLTRPVLLQGVVLVITLILLEVLLQVASSSSLRVRRALAPPWDVAAPLVLDPRMIARGNPLHHEHDSRGYRNERALDRAEIVTLGDSHTYGALPLKESWPRLLSARLKVAVYNMALPAYGPLQNELQLDEALALRPRAVILAPYFGNDLHDTFQMTRRHPGMLEGVSADLREAADARERLKPIYHEIYTLIAADEIRPPAARTWFSQHLKLYGFLRALKNGLASPPPPNPLVSRQFSTAAAALTPWQRDYASPMDGSGWRTILSARIRLIALDHRDPRIQLGFEAMRASIVRMAKKCRAAGVRFLVALMPTKESVFFPRVTDPDRHPGLRDQVSLENQWRGELMEALESHRIEVIDLLGLLRQAPSQPYYEDVDGHPNFVGNQVIEAAIAVHLAR